MIIRRRKFFTGLCAALIAGPALAQYPLTAGPVPYVSAPAGTPSEGANFAINNVNKYLSGQYGGVAIVNPTFTGTLTGPTYAGDGSGLSVTAAGSTTPRTAAIRAADVINVKDYGAVSDGTGAVGVGTDNSAAFQAAMGTPNTHVFIPPGQYRFTQTINVASGVVVDCSGQNVTTLWQDDSTGTRDGFYSNHGFANAFRHCFFARTNASTPTAGALIHVTDTGAIRFEDNRVGYAGTGLWDGVKVDCVTKNSLEIYFISNTFEGAFHDDVNLACTNVNYVISDVFFEARNYISSAAHAGVELNGSVGWTHFDQNDFDQNPGTAILGNATGGSTGNEANFSIHGGHFEGNGDDINLTAESYALITGNEFITKGGITCTLCGQGISSANSYSNNTGLQLNGVDGWSESGSFWDTSSTPSRSGMVTISPSGTTPSSNISISGGEFQFTYVPFLNFSGSAYPATNVTLNINSGQGACWAGTNYVVASFVYDCSGQPGPASSTKSVVGDITLLGSSPGIYGNLYYQSGWKYVGNGSAGGIQFGQNSGTHAIDLIYASLNSSGAASSAGKTVAGYVATDGSLQWGTSANCGSGCGDFSKLYASNLYLTNLLESATLPTISSGFGTSPTITSNGTASLLITVGSAPTGTGALALPSASNGWSCALQDETSAGSIVIAEAAHSTTTANFQAFSRTTGATTNFNAGDALSGSCSAY